MAVLNCQIHKCPICNHTWSDGTSGSECPNGAAHEMICLREKVDSLEEMNGILFGHACAHHVCPHCDGILPESPLIVKVEADNAKLKADYKDVVDAGVDTIRGLHGDVSKLKAVVRKYAEAELKVAIANCWDKEEIAAIKADLAFALHEGASNE